MKPRKRVRPKPILDSQGDPLCDGYRTEPKRKRVRHAETLRDFVAYCKVQPELRFWQALASWANVGQVLTNVDGRVQDTFYWEGRRG